MQLIRMTVISAAVIFTLGSQNLLAEDTISVSELKNEIADLKTSLKNLNSVLEQALSQSTPRTAIMAFYSKECPTGWLPANGEKNIPDLRGEFIRGLDRGRGVDKFYELDKNTLVATPPKERPLGSWQAPTLITTAIGPDGTQQGVIEGSPENEASWDDFSSGMQTDWIENSWYSNAFKGMIYVGLPSNMYKEDKRRYSNTDDFPNRPINGNPKFVSGGSRPRNVALLYCMKE